MFAIKPECPSSLSLISGTLVGMLDFIRVIHLLALDFLFRAVKLAMASSMVLKKLKIELYFSIPAEMIMKILRVIGLGKECEHVPRKEKTSS